MKIELLVRNILIAVVVINRVRSETLWQDYFGQDPHYPNNYDSMLPVTNKTTTNWRTLSPFSIPSVVIYTTPNPPKKSHTVFRPEKYDDVDDMPLEERTILCKMVKEVYIDSFVHRDVTRAIIYPYHSSAVSYEIGYLVGLVRVKYRRMMELYRETTNKQSVYNRPPRTVIPPKGQTMKIKAYMLWTIYEIMHELEWEIEKLVERLEKVPLSELRMVPEDVRAPVNDSLGNPRGDYDVEDEIGGDIRDEINKHLYNYTQSPKKGLRKNKHKHKN